jgi:hypothetical protein
MVGSNLNLKFLAALPAANLLSRAQASVTGAVSVNRKTRKAGAVFPCQQPIYHWFLKIRRGVQRD